MMEYVMAIVAIIIMMAIYYFVLRKPCEHLVMKKSFGIPTNLIDPHYDDNLKRAQLDKLDRAVIYR